MFVCPLRFEIDENSVNLQEHFFEFQMGCDYRASLIDVVNKASAFHKCKIFILSPPFTKPQHAEPV